jgi:hypothetical protein
VNRAAAACLLLLASAGCSGGGARAPIDAAVRRDAPPVDHSIMPQGDPALCGCSIDAQGTLNLFWSCYCGQSFANCAAPLSVPADCASQIRRDYPACGFTVITALTAAGDQVASVYDASGNQVGRIARSDLSGYSCPVDSTMVSTAERAGQFPASSCEAVGCDPCYAGPFPCAPLDAATGDSAAAGTSLECLRL